MMYLLSDPIVVSTKRISFYLNHHMNENTIGGGFPITLPFNNVVSECKRIYLKKTQIGNFLSEIQELQVVFTPKASSSLYHWMDPSYQPNSPSFMDKLIIDYNQLVDDSSKFTRISIRNKGRCAMLKRFFPNTISECLSQYLSTFDSCFSEYYWSVLSDFKMSPLNIGKVVFHEIGARTIKSLSELLGMSGIEIIDKHGWSYTREYYIEKSSNMIAKSLVNFEVITNENDTANKPYVKFQRCIMKPNSETILVKDSRFNKEDFQFLKKINKTLEIKHISDFSLWKKIYLGMRKSNNGLKNSDDPGNAHNPCPNISVQIDFDKKNFVNRQYFTENIYYWNNHFQSIVIHFTSLGFYSSLLTPNSQFSDYKFKPGALVKYKKIIETLFYECYTYCKDVDKIRQNTRYTIEHISLFAQFLMEFGPYKMDCLLNDRNPLIKSLEYFMSLHNIDEKEPSKIHGDYLCKVCQKHIKTNKLCCSYCVNTEMSKALTINAYRDYKSELLQYYDYSGYISSLKTPRLHINLDEEFAKLFQSPDNLERLVYQQLLVHNDICIIYNSDVHIHDDCGERCEIIEHEIRLKIKEDMIQIGVPRFLINTDGES